MASISEVFGEKFAYDLKQASKKNFPKLKLEGAIREEVIKSIVENKDKFKSGTPAINKQIGDNLYSIVLVETQEEINWYDFKNGGHSINRGIKWGNKFLTVNSDDKVLLERIQPNNAYILIGYAKSDPKENGTVFYRLRLDGVIELEELAQYQSKDD